MCTDASTVNIIFLEDFLTVRVVEIICNPLKNEQI